MPIAESRTCARRSTISARLHAAWFAALLAIVSLVIPANTPSDAMAAKAAEPDSVATRINAAVAFDVLANDPSGMGIIDHTMPAHGELARRDGGEFSYLPHANYVGTDTFSYRAQHGSDEIQTAMVTIDVTGNVTSVEARDDDLRTDEDIPAAAYVLANDGRGPGGLPVSVTIDKGPEHGTAELQADGSILYTPAQNWSGADSIVYTASDGATSDTASVSIIVLPVDEPPSPVNDAAITRQGGSASIDVLANDGEADGDEFAFVGNSQPMYGTATWSSVDHMIIYVPVDGFWGTDQFTYTVGDFDGTATATVTVTVNGAPAPQADAATTDQGTAVDIPVLANDSDPEGDALTVSSVSTATHGELLINADSTVRYLPDANFSGQDTFSYVVRDALGNEQAGSVSVTVAPAGTPSSGALADEFLVLEDSPGNTLDVLSNDRNPGGGVLTIGIDTTPAHGTLVLDATQTLTYVPEPGYVGPDAFTYSISDGVNPRSSATVMIEIQPVNDAPVAVADSATGDEDTDIVVDAIANDTDEEGDDLSVDAVTQPANGSARMARDGSVIYRPNPEFSGFDAFDYVVSDGNGGTGTATITVTVNPVNDPPVAKDDRAHAEIGVALVIDALANDHDPDGPQRLLSITKQPEHGTASVTAYNTIAYAPEAKFEGYDTIQYQLSDGLATATATVKITVGNPNADPEAKDDEATTTVGQPVTIAVLENDTDKDDDKLTLYGITEPEHGTVAAEKGEITYAPDPDFVGTDSFTYKVRDGKGGRDKAEVTLTINPAHDRRAGDK